MLCLAPSGLSQTAYVWYFGFFYFLYYSVGWSTTIIAYDALVRRPRPPLPNTHHHHIIPRPSQARALHVSGGRQTGLRHTSSSGWGCSGDGTHHRLRRAL